MKIKSKYERGSATSNLLSLISMRGKGGMLASPKFRFNKYWTAHVTYSTSPPDIYIFDGTYVYYKCGFREWSDDADSPDGRLEFNNSYEDATKLRDGEYEKIIKFFMFGAITND